MTRRHLKIRALGTGVSLLTCTILPLAHAQNIPPARNAPRTPSTVRVEDLDLSRVQTGYGAVRSKLSVDGHPLTVGSKTFVNGLGVHAPSTALIELDGGSATFTAQVGVDDEVKGQRASLEFRVYADDKLAWQSGMMHAGDAPKPVAVSLQGVKRLKLEVTDGGNGRDYDHADWGEAQITYTGMKPQLARDPRQIWVETANAALVFYTGDDGRLYQLHFGAHNASLSTETNAGNEAFPPAGERSVLEPAISVTHADGNTSLSLRVMSQSTRALDANVSETQIALQDPNYPFFVTLHFKAYRAEDIIEAWMEARHTENGPVTLSQFASSAPIIGRANYVLTHFHGDWADEMNPVQETLTDGTKTLDSKLGVRAHQFRNPTFLLSPDAPASEEAGEVIGGALAYSGNFALRFEVAPDHRLRAICGMNPEASAYRLAPNQTFTTPSMIWGWSGQGRGPLSRHFHHWARNYVLRDGNQPRAVLLNNWEATFFNFNETKLVSLFDGARDAGMELFLLDDGWFGTKYPRDNDTQGLGDWSVDARKLPHGIQYLAEQAKARGLRFGLWLEPEMVNPKSALFEQHPDWAIRQPGRDLDLQRNQLVLDLTRPAVKEYVFGVIHSTLTRNPGISYIKWDCNRYITQPGSSYLPANDQSALWIDYGRALYDIMDRVAKAHPNVQIMMCSGGGSRVDFGSLRYGQEFWPSDNTDPVRRVSMQWSYSQFFPSIAIAAHVTEWGNRPLKFAFDVAMSERLGMDYDLGKLSPADKTFAREAVATYKRIRDVVQLGDLYRLESPYETPRSCLLYVAPDQRRAVFFALQTKDGAASVVPLRGLDPKLHYRVREINLRADTPSRLTLNNQLVDGATLMTMGLTPTVSKSLDSCVVEITAE